MSPRATVALNYTLYQVGWLAAVGGAAIGYGTAGAAIAALLTLVHLWLARDRAGEIRLAVTVLVLGAAVETTQIGAGTYVTLGGSPPAWWPPAWLLALWAQFATTFRFSAATLLARPWAAATCGALGGPLAFVAGERLGAVTLARPLTPALIALGVAWTLAMAASAVLVRVVPRRGPATYRATTGAAG